MDTDKETESKDQNPMAFQDRGHGRDARVTNDRNALRNTGVSPVTVATAFLILFIAFFILSCQSSRTALKQTPTTQKYSGYFSYPGPISGKTHSREELQQINQTSSCTACHRGYGIYEHTMHNPDNTFVGITCVECHGGNADIKIPRDIKPTDTNFVAFQKAAHVQPKQKDLWGKSWINPNLPSSANPEIPYAATMQESADYIRFVNPGDLRAAVIACGSCHESQVKNSPKSMMAHGAMLWEAAFYNNGDTRSKIAVYGDDYMPNGEPARIIPHPAPTTRQVLTKGILPELWPIPRWEVSQPGNILRVFERGGRERPELGVPSPKSEPGRPDVKLSIRGLGTDLRTDPVFLGLQKTRLMDPTLNLFGTNDHPGDYRASGCSACHVVYANDRSPVHSAYWSKFGNLGRTQNPDPMISKTESGHPIVHQFQRQVASSTCIVCHVHPGTNVVNAYFGFQWWDNETDGKLMYPAKQKNPSAADLFESTQHNPEAAAARGKWSNPDFLANVTNLNPLLARTQFGDFHGHGWIFRAVFKQDKQGHLLDTDNKIVTDVNVKKLSDAVAFTSDDKSPKPPAGHPVHLKDIHLEKGMHCVDCHFSQDVHGDGNLYGETRAAVMVECVDCHGTQESPANISRFLAMHHSEQSSDEGKRTLANAFTGAAASNGSADSKIARNRAILDNHFDVKNGKLWQKSALDPNKGWFVMQTADTVGKSASPAARFAHTIRRDGKTWGSLPEKDNKNPMMELAHRNSNMACYACHTSWTTACFGCHLPMKSNARKAMLHNEGSISRNYTNYNFQTLRDDVYMLGIDGTAEKHRIVPIRSSCAIMVSSENGQREQLYEQQQTISAEGFAGTAFSPYFPHTVRGSETKTCTDCHISSKNDNNAWMAQVLLQGTNSVNFIGRFAYVAEGHHGLEAVGVSKRTEPQAVYGSSLDSIAYPDDYKSFVAHGRTLDEHYDHHGHVLDLQQRGEYLYAACAEDGFIAYDIANIDNKGFSERILTAPVSPLGQRFYVKSKYATSICSPSTLALDPTRPHYPINQEQSIHPLYAFLYMTDAIEGLIVIGNPLNTPHDKGGPGVSTLLDGDPDNNFLQRAVTFNPGDVLRGARSMTLYGHYAYIAADEGVVVVNLDNPLNPKVVNVIKMSGATKIATQFRYAFVITQESPRLRRGSLQVLDITNPEHPHMVEGATLNLTNPRDIYLSRTYAYIANGRAGLAIIDITRPEHPLLDQSFTANNTLTDTTAVKIAMTNASMFAYIADGRNGLKVVQLTSPEDTPTYLGFSPRPNPHLIATYKTNGPAIALSKGLDRDRAVDESGHQLAVFGRRGARPFTLEEQRKLYTHPDGSLYTVTDEPSTQPLEPKEDAKPVEQKPAESPRRRLFPGRR